MITFIATSYNETKEAYQFISSLLLQTDKRWKCIIINDGQNEELKKIINHFSDQRIIFYEVDRSGYWGHYNRKIALEYVDTEFLIQTSIQDYYLPITVETLLSIAYKFDIILYNCLHNHKNYDVLNSEPQICCVDWGSTLVRTTLAKEIGIQNPEYFACDGLFVENCLKNKNTLYYKLNKILTVHN
jgi:glycosyltransferase involved in cell wall biosynthesis